MKNNSRLNLTARILLTVLFGTTLSIVLYLVTQTVADSTIFHRPATCVSDHCFCEQPSGSVPEQILNSLSSLAFIFLGIWALLSTREPVKGMLERRIKPIFAIILLFLGASSFIYHATLSFFGQFLDIFSMYTFGILLTVGALYRSGRVREVAAILIFLVSNVVFAAVQFNFPEARRVLFVALLLPGILLELLPSTTGHRPRSRQVRYIYIGVGLMLVAYALWTLDQMEDICDPHSILQGHAIWHVLTAVAAFCIILHYRQTPHPTTARRLD